MNNSASVNQIPAPKTRAPLASWLFCEMQNAQHIHERWMSRFLQRRGWVVFYLDEQAQFCPALKPEQTPSDCWLALWKSGRCFKSAK